MSQQALLAGLFMEAAIENDISPVVSVSNVNRDNTLRSAHAWAVYRKEGKEDVIVDAAQRFVGYAFLGLTASQRWRLCCR